MKAVLGFALGIAPFASIAAAASVPALPGAVYQGVYLVEPDGNLFTGRVSSFGPLQDQDLAGRLGSRSTILGGVLPDPDPAVSVYSTVSAPADVNGAIANVIVAGSTSNGIGSQAGSGAAFMTYEVEFLGPTTTVPIQVDARLQASLSAFPPGSTDADLLVESSLWVGVGASRSFSDVVHIETAFPQFGTGRLQAYAVDAAGSRTDLAYTATGVFGQLNDSHVWEAQTDVVYTVRLEADQILTVNGLLGGGSLEALNYIDPTFEVAATVDDPSAYAVLVSPGVGNSAVVAVPEASTIGLLVAGLSLFPLAFRKGRAVDH